MRQALTILFVLIAWSIFAQRTEWGVVISVAHSQAHMARGFGVSYPSTPFFAGELVVEERTVPGFSTEIFREKQTRLKHVSVKTAIGFLSCGALLNYDYDYANSIGSIVSIENRYGYVTINGLARYSIPISTSATITASLGPHLGYLVYSNQTSTYFRNGEFVQGNFNALSRETPLNYGSQFAFGGKYKRISIETFYRSYYKFHYGHSDGRRVFNYGLALSFYLQRNKHKVNHD